MARVDADAIDRTRSRLQALTDERSGDPALRAALDRAREGIEAFAQTTAELQVSLPERVSETLHESLRTEVLPVARHIAEVRGLSGQTIRRLERLQGDLEAERRARVEDLALLVDLVTTGWRSVERRLTRIERMLERIEQHLDERARPGSSVLRLEDRRPPAG